MQILSLLKGDRLDPLPTALCETVLERITLTNGRLGALTDVLYASARDTRLAAWRSKWSVPGVRALSPAFR